MPQSAKRILEIALKYNGKNQSNAAAMLGLMPQYLNRKFQLNTIRWIEFALILSRLEINMIGYKDGIEFVIIDENTNVDPIDSKDIIHRLQSTYNLTMKAIGESYAKTYPRKVPAQVIRDRYLRNSFIADEMLLVLENLDMEVKYISRRTNMEIKVTENPSQLSKQGSSHGMWFNTNSSVLLADTYYLDGVNKYNNGEAEELFIDKNGVYFIALCKKDGTCKLEYRSPREALAFIEKYAK